jgi:RNA polymerase subunit RPABC4/transcription elongation factor Spt4
MESITSLIVGAASVIGAIIAALLAGLTVWAFRDIRSRTRDPFVQILATILVGVVPIAGILVYLMLRPRETLAESYVRALEEESLLSSIESQEFCPTCGRRVEGDMQWCPGCHSKLRNACGNCGRAVHLSWDLCPYCGTGLQPELPAAGAKVKVAAPQPKRMPTPNAPNAIPAGAAPEALGGSVLDRVSGAAAAAVGSVADRVTARIQNTQSNARVEIPERESKAPTEIDLPAVDDDVAANGNGAAKSAASDIAQQAAARADKIRKQLNKQLGRDA